jgi:hypothetical protein
MFSFIDAGDWFAHFIRSSGTVLRVRARALPVNGSAPKTDVAVALREGSPAMTSGTKRNWESKHLAKIARWLGGKNSLVKTIQLPHMRNVMHSSCEIRAFWFWDDR